ncbi:hypothetical protein [Undibacterium sp. YM2]|uniref:hypothetical protein n=1 Tax=Undibacterium sp. YM2 TaxID=2058625 RepID=UPI001389D7CB|nr:hypothetical protein [Undibacterium sp. YM2]
MTLQTVPPLDASLAEPCKTLSAPEALDYDQWQLWMQNTVLRAYGECAAKHRKVVRAWPTTTKP